MRTLPEKRNQLEP